MYFKTLIDFLAMGGYAYFVWSAYGIVFIVLIINFLIPLIAKHNFFAKNKRNRNQIF